MTPINKFGLFMFLAIIVSLVADGSGVDGIGETIVFLVLTITAGVLLLWVDKKPPESEEK